MTIKIKDILDRADTQENAEAWSETTDKWIAATDALGDAWADLEHEAGLRGPSDDIEKLSDRQEACDRLAERLEARFEKRLG